MIILLSTHALVLFVGRGYGSKDNSVRPEVAKWTSYGIVLIGGAWAVIRFALDWPIWFSATYLDGFVLGGLSASLCFSFQIDGKKPLDTR
jgi:hypothetical protein